MMIIVCPGIHSPHWTQAWLKQLAQAAPEVIPTLHIAPVAPLGAWSPYQVRQGLEAAIAPPPTSLIFIAFSAGCVAAAALAHHCHHRGYAVRAVIAWDGWGVPLAGPFPVHRLSHDVFTHRTSGSAPSLGHFYSDPPVSHGHLWQSPATVPGWQTQPGISPAPKPPPGPRETDSHPGAGSPQPLATTALDFLVACLRHYGEF